MYFNTTFWSFIGLHSFFFFNCYSCAHYYRTVLIDIESIIITTVESWLHEMGGDYFTYNWYACWLLTRRIENIYTTMNKILKRKLAVID